MSKIDLNRVWDDARAMGSANKDLLAAIAGMFVLLPLAVATRLVTLPEKRLDEHATQEAATAWYSTLLQANWHIFVGLNLLIIFAGLAMLALLLRDERPTVGESLKAAILVLPSFFVAYVVKNLALELGMFLFVLPAFYLFGRLILMAPVAAAEREYNPITIISRSFVLTRGNGWRLFLLLAILFVTTLIFALVVSTLVGLVCALLLPADIAELVTAIVMGLILAGFQVMAALLSAAVYRATTAPAPTPWLPGAGG